MEMLHIFQLIIVLSSASCKFIDVLPKPLGKQLFLSRNVITASDIFDGGVLVDENGIIEAVLKRDIVNSLLSQNLNDIKIIDGGELAMMAGVVDSHVHVNEPGRTSWEGYVTATQAAAAGGVTTIIDMPLNSIPPTTTVENLKVKAAIARDEVFVDVGFWGGVVPGNEIELHDLIRTGVVGFKCFLSDSGVSEFPMINPDQLTKAFSILNGTGTVLAFHAEVSLNNTDNSTKCDGNSCPDPAKFSTYLASKPAEMELEAVSLIASYVPQTDLHVHVVHVSAEGVVPILEKARAERLRAGYKGWRGGVTSETCHHYLTLSAEQIPPGHTEFKCSPPIRNITNKLKLWDYIRDQRLDLITSDHSPSVEDLKGSNFMTSWGGISSVQFGLSLFWTEAKARGFSLSAVSHYLSDGPARLVGLQNKKGSIRPGLDADLIFFDPSASFVITPEIIRYKNKISPYMYRVLTGVVQRTYLRGQLVFADDSIVGGPRGQLLLNDDMLLKVKKYYDLTTNTIRITPGKSKEISTKVFGETKKEVNLDIHYLKQNGNQGEDKNTNKATLKKDNYTIEAPSAVELSFNTKVTNTNHITNTNESSMKIEKKQNNVIRLLTTQKENSDNSLLNSGQANETNVNKGNHVNITNFKYNSSITIIPENAFISEIIFNNNIKQNDVTLKRVKTERFEEKLRNQQHITSTTSTFINEACKVNNPLLFLVSAMYTLLTYKF